MKISRSLRSKALLIALPALAFVVVGCGQNEESASKPPPPAGVEKKPAAVGTTPAAPASQQRRMAVGERKILLTIRNDTARTMTLKIIKVDNYDWTSPRPDWTRDGTPEHPNEKGGFQGTTLKPQEEDTRDLGANRTADVYFEIEFHLDNNHNQDPPTVRLQKKTRYEAWDGFPLYYGAFGSSDTKDTSCRAVTKSFPAQKVKVTMVCDVSSERYSLVKIEKL